MKANEWTPTTSKVFYGIATAVLILSLLSCATKAIFLTSNVVPAARGSVTLKDDKNNNYVIKVKITNLAEAERLQQSSNTYVVWMETEKNTVRNLGAMKSSTGFMSKNLTASFQTVTSIKPTKIFVTAENNAAIQYPSEAILSTDRF
jgi:hypothetical protein